MQEGDDFNVISKLLSCHMPRRFFFIDAYSVTITFNTSYFEVVVQLKISPAM